MKLPPSLRGLLLALALPAALQAGGDKAPPSSISFHMQGAVAEAPRISREVTTQAGQGYFRIIPEISNRDIKCFSPFPSSEDNTYGALFILTKQGARKLELATTANQGKLLLSIVNGRPHEVVKIDRPIKDGKATVWRGLTLDQVKMFDLLAPRIDEDPDDWKKRTKILKKEMKKKIKAAEKALKK